MFKKSILVAVLFGLMATVTGCKPSEKTAAEAVNKNNQAKLPPQKHSGSNYFQTQFQTESQFVIEAVVADLAQEIYFAAKHQLPPAESFSVKSTETGGTKDAPIYEIQIGLDSQHTNLACELNINGPIWSPEIYADLSKKLAQASGLVIPTSFQDDDTAMLVELLDGDADTIEKQDLKLSAALAKDFTNSELHQQAALLLGAFLLRDYSGSFFEIRSPLCRLTTHLVMAELLNNSLPLGVNGKLAEAIMLQQAGDTILAFAVLGSLNDNDKAVLKIKRAIQAGGTGDFRSLENIGYLSPLEKLTLFETKADYIGTVWAWAKLEPREQRSISYVRAANALGYSVEIGHQLLEFAIPLELQEIQTVHQLSRGKSLDKADLVAALNELPEYCVTADGASKPRIRVIGWGQWAHFLQRHLCHAVTANFTFMNEMWGVPEDAKEFIATCDKQFGRLRFYPFVQRFTCTDVTNYHRSVDDGFIITRDTPHLTPAECWNFLCYKPKFAPVYQPNPNPHINEWHNHNPLPGTVYNIAPRFNHPSLVNRRDYLAHLKEMHKLAPYDVRISDKILKVAYTNHATFDQAYELYGPISPWSAYALCILANTVYDDPARYEKLMNQAGDLSPNKYYDLADYFIYKEQYDKGSEYMEKACARDEDAVRVANHAQWRVEYFLYKTNLAKAGEVADFAAEVYSYKGLAAKAYFMEAITNYEGAFTNYLNIEERYQDSIPLIAFCQRYKAKTGKSNWDVEVANRTGKIFPKGMKNVTLADFHDSPTNGVLIAQENDLLRNAGMNANDVIVAIGGIRVQTMMQYTYLRDSQTTPSLELIVWHGGKYQEIKASPPNRRFGVNFMDYIAQKKR